jgi:hypothetical protein
MANTLTILHPQWRDEWDPTNYPFGDWATLTNQEGAFIQEGTFLDASLYPVDGGPKLRLSKVVVADQTIQIFIGDPSNDELASGILDLLNPTDDIELTDKYDRAAGILVSTVERLLVFQTWSLGTHEFSFEQTGFLSYVSLPTYSDCFKGFLLEDGSVVSGDIWILGEGGVVLSHDTLDRPDACPPGEEESLSEHRIRVDIIGDPLSLQRLCGDDPKTPKFLQTMTFRRGCDSIVSTPDENGEIKITSGRSDGTPTILRIRNVDGKLLIEAAGGTLEGSS